MLFRLLCVYLLVPFGMTTERRAKAPEMMATVGVTVVKEPMKNPRPTD